MFCAINLRCLAKYGRTALRNQHVNCHTKSWICSYARVAVRTTALQSYDQIRNRHWLPATLIRPRQHFLDCSDGRRNGILRTLFILDHEGDDHLAGFDALAMNIAPIWFASQPRPMTTTPAKFACFTKPPRPPPCGAVSRASHHVFNGFMGIQNG